MEIIKYVFEIRIRFASLIKNAFFRVRDKNSIIFSMAIKFYIALKNKIIF